jgi:hypothetical protein
MPNYNLVVCDGEKEAELAAIISAILTGSIYRLFTNSPVVDHNSNVTGFTEAAWTGYAGQTLTGWTAPALDGSNNAFTTADPVVVPNGDVVNHVANGYYITESGGPLVGAAYFPAPVTVPAGLGLQDTVTYTLQATFATSP